MVGAGEDGEAPPTTPDNPRISIASMAPPDTERVLPSGSTHSFFFERLSKIRDEIVRVLEADGEPKQAFRRP
jgi:hypothetical protein